MPEDIKLSDLTPSARTRLRNQLLDEVEKDVYQHYLQRIREYAHTIERAKEIIQAQNNSDRTFPLTRQQFMMIVASLHPDHNTYHRGREALDLFRSLERMLVKVELPRLPGQPPAPPLPTTSAELDAMRKQPKQRQPRPPLRRGN